jgi:hypothetical protein
MHDTTICEAIAQKKRIQIHYKGGARIVEPHQVAYNERNNLALSAYFVRGYSSSGSGVGWREYLISDIQGVQILEENFSTRPDYNPNGTKFHSTVCAV